MGWGMGMGAGLRWSRECALAVDDGMRCAMGGNRLPFAGIVSQGLSFRFALVCLSLSLSLWAPSVDEASEANELKVIIRHVYFLFAYGL